MSRTSPIELVWVAVLGFALFVSALSLVDLHYRTRQVFVAHERELDTARKLLDDQAELQMKVRRASLPGSIVAGARELGLKGATGDNTVTLVRAKDGTVVLSEETKARIAAEAAAQAERRVKLEAQLAKRQRRAKS